MAAGCLACIKSKSLGGKSPSKNCTNRSRMKTLRRKLKTKYSISRDENLKQVREVINNLLKDIKYCPELSYIIQLEALYG